MKYIIKKCPACMEVIETDCAHTFCCTDNHNAYCKNVTDCLLKRIVEKCKNKADLCKNCMGNFLLNGCEKCPFDTHGLAQEILNLLEIEEANEQF